MLVGLKGFYQRRLSVMDKRQINSTIRELKSIVRLLENNLRSD